MVGAFPADPELPLKIGGRCSGLALRTSKITHVDEFTGFVRQSQDDDNVENLWKNQKMNPKFDEIVRW
jgi:hypothetical protein